MGIGAKFLTRWKREAEQNGTGTFVGSGSTRDEEVPRVRKERDFLREAATFFARESS